jgi:uncharacterized protein (DUF2141 family)
LKQNKGTCRFFLSSLPGGAALALAFVLASPLLAEPDAAPQAELTVEVEGFADDLGLAWIALHNTKDTYLTRKAPFRQAKAAVRGQKAECTFAGLPPGNYAVAVFQDRNGNGDLDRNWLGIPREPYGFSNNPSSAFGPPRYRQVEFQLGAEAKTVAIKVEGGKK